MWMQAQHLDLPQPPINHDDVMLPAKQLVMQLAVAHIALMQDDPNHKLNDPSDSFARKWNSSWWGSEIASPAIVASGGMILPVDPHI